MNNKILKKIFLLGVISLFLLGISEDTQAASPPYKLLVPLGDLTEVSFTDTDFSNYLQRIINIAIGITGAISVIMLIIGGLQYVLSSVSETAKKDAKERITNAVIGVLIALSGYIILYTINPNLTSIAFPALNLQQFSRTPIDNPNILTLEESKCFSAKVNYLVKNNRSGITAYTEVPPGTLILIRDQCRKNPYLYPGCCGEEDEVNPN